MGTEGKNEGSHFSLDWDTVFFLSSEPLLLMASQLTVDEHSDGELFPVKSVKPAFCLNISNISQKILILLWTNINRIEALTGNLKWSSKYHLSSGTSKSWKLKFIEKKNILAFIFYHLDTKQERGRNAATVHTQHTEIRIKDGFGIKTGSLVSFTQCPCFWSGGYFPDSSIYHSSPRLPAQWWPR